MGLHAEAIASSNHTKSKPHEKADSQLIKNYLYLKVSAIPSAYTHGLKVVSRNHSYINYKKPYFSHLTFVISVLKPNVCFCVF